MSDALANPPQRPTQLRPGDLLRAKIKVGFRGKMVSADDLVVMMSIVPDEELRRLLDDTSGCLDDTSFYCILRVLHEGRVIRRRLPDSRIEAWFEVLQ